VVYVYAVIGDFSFEERLDAKSNYNIRKGQKKSKKTYLTLAM
jgi:hypothetical protein